MDDIIINYLNEDISEKEKEQLLSWINESEENHKYFLEIRDLWITSTEVLSTEAEANEAFSFFRGKILSYEKQRTKQHSILRYVKWVAAAVVFLCIGSWCLYYLAPEDSLPIKNSVAETLLKEMTTNDNKHVITLSDGTIVCLNSNSKLIYPERFDADKRIVSLEGEGFFDVEHNEQAPFYVEMKDMTIKVLGTEFDCQSYSGKNITETVLLSGKVEIRLHNNNKPILLSPNQRFSLNKDTEHFYLDSIDASGYVVWTQDKLVMTDQDLDTILRNMERWYNTDFLYKDDIPLQSKYSLTVRNESMEEMLRLLSIMAHIEYRIEDDKVIIVSKK